MPLPFTYQATLTTALSADEVAARMTEHNNQRNNVQYAWSFRYFGTVDRAGFSLRAQWDRKEKNYTKVKGKLLSENPTTLELTITPGYLGLVTMLAFIILFFTVVMSTDQMRLNGVLRTFDFMTRLKIGGGISLALLAYLYFKTILPVGRAKRWLIKHLELRG